MIKINNLNGIFYSLRLIDKNEDLSNTYNSLKNNTLKTDWEYIPYRPFDSLEEFKHWISFNKLQNIHLFSIIDNSSNFAGLISIFDINFQHMSAEIGHIHIINEAKKTQALTESVFLLLSHFFDNLSFKRIVWKCHSDNKNSIESAERLGFKYEGTFRNHWIINNKSRDTSWFSIIDSEWLMLNNKFIKWLDRKNFNKNIQIKKLNDF